MRLKKKTANDTARIVLVLGDSIIYSVLLFLSYSRCSDTYGSFSNAFPPASASTAILSFNPQTPKINCGVNFGS